MPKEGFVYVCPTARASNARDSLDIDDRSPVIGCDRSAYPYQECSLTLADNLTLNNYDYPSVGGCHPNSIHTDRALTA